MTWYDSFVNGENMHEALKQNRTIRAGALAQLPVFLEVAQRRSFAAAARALRLSPSAVSQAVARLEQDLGVTLLVRTTRSVSLTPAGTRLLSDAAPAIAMASAALSAAWSGRDEPSGTLRLNVPRIACRVGLLPVVEAFARRYPGVRTEVVVDDQPIDVVRDGFDAGVRLKRSVHADMIRVRISPPLRMVVLGSERYFAARGRPQHPRELADHACLGWRLPDGGGEYRWEFREEGRKLEVAVTGPVFSGDVELLLAAAERDLGLAYVAEPEGARATATGTLEAVLHAYSLEHDGLFLYFPRAARNVPKLRAFVDCARDVAQAAG